MTRKRGEAKNGIDNEERGEKKSNEREELEERGTG